jgi:hypothetical protein
VTLDDSGATDVMESRNFAAEEPESTEGACARRSPRYRDPSRSERWRQDADHTGPPRDSRQDPFVQSEPTRAVHLGTDKHQQTAQPQPEEQDNDRCQYAVGLAVAREVRRIGGEKR